MNCHFGAARYWERRCTRLISQRLEALTAGHATCSFPSSMKSACLGRSGRRLRTRVASRGVTLFEVLIVVAILALISAGAAFAIHGPFTDAKRRTAATDARSIRQAVKGWWALKSETRCPSVEDLVQDGILDRDSPRKDPWGEAWRLECSDADVTITSLGQDRQEGTSDDIRIPPA